MLPFTKAQLLNKQGCHSYWLWYKIHLHTNAGRINHMDLDTRPKIKNSNCPWYSQKDFPCFSGTLHSREEKRGKSGKGLILITQRWIKHETSSKTSREINRILKKTIHLCLQLRPLVENLALLSRKHTKIHQPLPSFFVSSIWSTLPCVPIPTFWKAFSSTKVQVLYFFRSQIKLTPDFPVFSWHFV